MSSKQGVLCIGEILWDGLPSGLYLGGAPLNVCYHLNQFNLDVSIASRVGDDRLGKEALQRIKNMGIPTELIQKDYNHETGFVCVELDHGDPHYTFVEPAAWDYIELSKQLDNLEEQFWGVIFGSLAQRKSRSRETIQKLCEMDVHKILDINLREPYIDKEIIKASLSVADIIKMNEDELSQLADWFSFSGEPRKAMEQLANKFDCSMIFITRGANGAVLLNDGEWFEHQGFSINVKDAVGAGDAFLAAMLYGLTNEHPGDQLLTFANATGALIAQKDGATPDYSMEDILIQMDQSNR